MKNMKYKVLAADDEFWSRENIRNLIPWEEYSLEFLEPACDGEEVIERIAEEKPDIILTDINMPFLSGLELLQRLQNEYPEIITIAISGYDDFDKVKGVFSRSSRSPSALVSTFTISSFPTGFRRAGEYKKAG